jgi:allantoinase
MTSLLVCSASKVLLPGQDEPTAATIIVDKASGKIIEVRETLLNRDEGHFNGQSIEWIDTGDNVVLPGMVE